MRTAVQWTDPAFLSLRYVCNFPRGERGLFFVCIAKRENLFTVVRRRCMFIIRMEVNRVVIMDA